MFKVCPEEYLCLCRLSLIGTGPTCIEKEVVVTHVGNDRHMTKLRPVRINLGKYQSGVRALCDCRPSSSTCLPKTLAALARVISLLWLRIKADTRH